MANKDLVLNKLSFDANGFFELFKKLCNVGLDTLSDQLVDIVRREVFKNGNGTEFMRMTAYEEVKETKREITEDSIILEAGIDMDELKGRGELVFARVSVVLHGNLASGPLITKPGQQTFTKELRGKKRSKATSVWMLPGEGTSAPPEHSFVKIDKMADIQTEVSKYISANATKQIQKHVDDFARDLSQMLSSINLSSFLIVG